MCSRCLSLTCMCGQPAFEANQEKWSEEAVKQAIDNAGEFRGASTRGCQVHIGCKGEECSYLDDREMLEEVLREVRALRAEVAALRPATVEVAPNQFKVVRGPVREVKP